CNEEWAGDGWNEYKREIMPIQHPQKSDELCYCQENERCIILSAGESDYCHGLNTCGTRRTFASARGEPPSSTILAVTQQRYH
ncbi:hypothetical protein PV325_009520, partial [Microctonus aethiopoides]